jgi:hypothetical protein
MAICDMTVKMVVPTFGSLVCRGMAGFQYDLNHYYATGFRNSREIAV